MDPCDAVRCGVAVAPRMWGTVSVAVLLGAMTDPASACMGPGATLPDGSGIKWGADCWPAAASKAVMVWMTVGVRL